MLFYSSSESIYFKIPKNYRFAVLWLVYELIRRPNTRSLVISEQKFLHIIKLGPSGYFANFASSIAWSQTKRSSCSFDPVCCMNRLLFLERQKCSRKGNWIPPSGLFGSNFQEIYAIFDSQPVTLATGARLLNTVNSTIASEESITFYWLSLFSNPNPRAAQILTWKSLGCFLACNSNVANRVICKALLFVAINHEAV